MIKTDVVHVSAVLELTWSKAKAQIGHLQSINEPKASNLQSKTGYSMTAQ